MECLFCGHSIPLETVSLICDYAGIATSIRLAISSKALGPAIIPIAANYVDLTEGMLEPINMVMLMHVEEKYGLAFRIRSLTMVFRAPEMREEEIAFLGRHSESITTLSLTVLQTAGLHDETDALVNALPCNLQRLNLFCNVVLLDLLIPRVAHCLQELSYGGFDDENERVDWDAIARVVGPLRLSDLRVIVPDGFSSDIPSQILQSTDHFEAIVTGASPGTYVQGSPNWHNIYSRIPARGSVVMCLSLFVRVWDEKVLQQLFLQSLPPDRPAGPFSEPEFIARISLLGDIVGAYSNSNKDKSLADWFAQQAALLMGPSPSALRQIATDIAFASNLNPVEGAAHLIAVMQKWNVDDPLELLLSFDMIALHQLDFLAAFIHQLLTNPRFNYHRFDVIQSMATWGGKTLLNLVQGFLSALWSPDLSENDLIVLKSGTRRYSSFRHWWINKAWQADWLFSVKDANITLPTPNLEMFEYSEVALPILYELAAVIPEPDIFLNRFFWRLLPARPELFLRSLATLARSYQLNIEQAVRAFLRLCDDLKRRRSFLQFGYAPIIGILPHVDVRGSQNDVILRTLAEYLEGYVIHPDFEVDLDFAEEMMQCLMENILPWNFLVRTQNYEANIRMICNTALPAMHRWDPMVYRWQKDPLVFLLLQIKKFDLYPLEALFDILKGPSKKQQSLLDFLNTLPVQTAATFVSAMFTTFDWSAYLDKNADLLGQLLEWGARHGLDEVLAIVLPQARFLSHPAPKSNLHQAQLPSAICILLLGEQCFVSLRDFLARFPRPLEITAVPVVEPSTLLAIGNVPREFPTIRQWILETFRRPSILVAMGPRLVPVLLTHFAEEFDSIFAPASPADARLREWSRLFGIKNYWNEHMMPTQGEEDSAKVFRLEQANIVVDRKALHDWYKSLSPAQTKLILRWGLSLLQRPAVPDEQLIWCLFDLLAALENWDGMLSTAISTEKAVARGEWKLSGLVYWTAAMVASYKMGNMAKARKYAAFMEFGPGAPLHYLGAEKIWKECYQPSPQPASAAAAQGGGSGGSSGKGKKKQKQKQKQKEKEKEKPVPAIAVPPPAPRGSSCQSSSSQKTQPASAPLPRRQSPLSSSSSSSSTQNAPEEPEENLKPWKTVQSPQKVAPTAQSLPQAAPSPAPASAPASPAQRSKYVSPPAGVFYLQCSICYERVPDFALQCGHMFCSECVEPLSTCAVCRQPVQSKFRLFVSSADEEKQ